MSFAVNILHCHRCAPGPTCPHDGIGAKIADRATDGLCPLGKFDGKPPTSAKPRDPNAAHAQSKFRELWRTLHRRPTRPIDLSGEGDWLRDTFRAALLPTCSCRGEYDNFVSTRPPDLSSPSGYFAWSHGLHNHVNAKLGKPLVSLALAARIHGAEGLFPPFVGPLRPIRLHLADPFSLGDAVCRTRTITDLHRAYPGVFAVSIDSKFPAVYENLPGVVPADGTPDIEFAFRNDYPPNRSLIEAQHEWLGEALNRKIPLTELRPDLRLSDDEWDAEPLVAGPFLAVGAGSKSDCPSKSYPHWQRVINALAADGVRVVLVGATGEGPCGAKHVQPDYSGAFLDLRGQTDIRQLFRLIAGPNCLAVVSVVTALVHVAAGFNKPAVVVAGAREKRSVALYEHHAYLDNIAAFACAGCWTLEV